MDTKDESPTARGNPLVLRVEKKHFYINTFGVPCHEVAKKTRTPPPSAIEPSREVLRSIGQAAKLLEAFHVTAQDVIGLVKRAQSAGQPSWTAAEAKMIAAVAKAWVVLAPLGVETADLRSLIDNASAMDSKGSEMSQMTISEAGGAGMRNYRGWLEPLPDALAGQQI